MSIRVKDLNYNSLVYNYYYVRRLVPRFCFDNRLIIKGWRSFLKLTIACFFGSWVYYIILHINFNNHCSNSTSFAGFKLKRNRSWYASRIRFFFISIFRCVQQVPASLCLCFFIVNYDLAFRQDRTKLKFSLLPNVTNRWIRFLSPVHQCNLGYFEDWWRPRKG